MAGAYVDPIEVCRRYDQLAATLTVPTPDYGPVVDTIASTGYPVGEACRLISTAHILGANADSISGWVNEIGALRGEVARLTALLSPVEALEALEASGDATG